jgi:hypothetical protein
MFDEIRQWKSGASLLAIRPGRYDLVECLARPDHFDRTVIDSADQNL